MKYYLLTIPMSLMLHVLPAQEHQLMLKRGAAYHNGQPCALGKSIALKTGDMVKLDAAALVLVKNSQGAVRQLQSGRSFSYADISKLFPRKTGFGTAASEVIFAQSRSSAQSGGVRRSAVDSFSRPATGFIVLSDSIRFEVDTRVPARQFLIGHLMIHPVADRSDSTVLMPQQIPATFPIPPPGTYIWTYRVLAEHGQFERINHFTVPFKEEREMFLHEYLEFSNSLGQFRFTPDMKWLLKQEFLNTKGWYLYGL